MIAIRTVLWPLVLMGCMSTSLAPVGASPFHSRRTPARVHLAVAHSVGAAVLARWQQQAELTAHDGVAGDHLGGPVALSGNMALVGAWDKQHGTGAAYLFVRQGNNWIEQAELHAAGGKAGDWFGVSVALSGNTALVGAPLADQTGVVYVFTQTAGRWIQQARLTPRDGHQGDWFGRTVALSGNTALVGAWDTHHATGAAYVFGRTGTGWIQQAELTARHGHANDYFGTSVALSGRMALVGAAGTNGNQGAAYVFVQQGVRWHQRALLTAADGRAGDTFGCSVALSGGTILVGAGFAHHNTGAAYVFVHRGSAWTEQAELSARDGRPGDWFGVRVALSGRTALVGAWYEQRHAGAAYVFVRTGTRWMQQSKLTARDEGQGDYFGTSVALNGTTALIGATSKHHAAGAAYVFEYRPAVTRGP